jgi:hypothetical protein
MRFFILGFILKAVITSLLPYQIYRNDSLPINKINSAIRLNSSHLLLSTSDGSIFSCHDLCDTFLNTSETNTLLEENNQLLIINKNNLTIFDRFDLTYLDSTKLNFSKVDSALIINNKTFAIGNNQSLTTVKIQKSFKYLKKLNKNNHINSLLILSNGMLVSGHENGNINVWDPNNNYSLIKSIETYEESGEVLSLTQLSNGVLVSGHDSRRINVWNPKDNYTLVTYIPVEQDWIHCSLGLSNGMLVTGSSKGKIKIWDPNNNYTLIKTLTDHSGNIGKIIELSDGKLVSGSYDQTIKFWDLNNNYSLIKTINTSSYVTSLVVLSNGIMASSSLDNIQIWNIKDNYKLVKEFTGKSYDTEFISDLFQLSDGILVSLCEWSSYFFNPEKDYKLVNSLTSDGLTGKSMVELSNSHFVSTSNMIYDYQISPKIIKTSSSNHSSDIQKIRKINESHVITFSEDMICLNNLTSLDEGLQVIQCQNNFISFSDILVLNHTTLITSDIAGHINYWDINDFKAYEIIHVNDIFNNKANYFYVTKLFKLNSGKLLAYLNRKTVAVLDQSNLALIYDTNYYNNSIPVEIFEVNSTTLMNVYPNGMLQYFTYKLYLDSNKFDYTIELKNVISQEENDSRVKIKLNRIPTCLLLYVGDKQVGNSSIIDYDDKLRYSINSPVCSPDEKLEFTTIKANTTNYYEIPVELCMTPNYSSSETKSSSRMIEVFKNYPLGENVRKIKFKYTHNGVIKYLPEVGQEMVSVEFDRYYDSNYKFVLIVDPDSSNTLNINIPFVLKDVYDISSEILNIQFIIEISPWYLRWYTILAFSLIVCVIIFAVFKLSCKKGDIENQESLIQPSSSKWNRMIEKCFCCNKKKVRKINEIN